MLRSGLHIACWGPKGGRLGRKTSLMPLDVPEALEILLKAGGNPNLKDTAGNTPMNVAAATNGYRCIPILLKYGADINIASIKGNTPTMKALYRGQIESYEILLKYGPDLSKVNNKGFSLLEMVLVFDNLKTLEYFFDKPESIP